ncbi:helix-turn-helix transcriptional regulator [Mesorhizobium sp. ZC-5]|uniref:helix-turn-helix transcriptional regulator n=1 Tax=Mesorhizobium sp. ZC-5 TaxID=2986066 RepID=UPI0021E76078|nr:AraC family transcriptional regulator [Mesorhizobium sp. ZC-5]MCV3241731.1 AraC family transcriptional regulator [Mesorhizobium sp. ZC-5]
MLNTAPSIKIRSFLQVAPYLAKRGISSIEFFRRLGISPNIFQDPDVYLPRALCFHIANEMVAATQDPFGGAHVGHMTELRSLGMWGKSILRSADVAHACELAATNVSMLHQGSNVHFITGDRTARIVYRFSGRCDMDPRQFIYGSLAVLRKVPLMTGEPAAIRVHLTTSRSRGDDTLEECLGPNIEMGCEHDMIEFDRALLDMPLGVQTDEASKVTEALRSAVDAAGLLIERLSDHRHLKLRAIAKRMGMSARTLQRRLKYCGIDFEDLLDETRRCEALRLISEGEHTMTDIAYRIGYSDPAHFTRAFRRWTGSAPSHFGLTRDSN